MKAPAVLFAALAVGLLAGACASDTPPAEVVQEHLARGVTGHGQIGPLDRGDDPFVNPRGGDTTPGHP